MSPRSIVAQVRTATIMKAIPRDAMETAINMVCEARNESVIVSSVPGAVIVARAIVAERERCAKVAEFWGCKGAAQEIVGDLHRIDQ